MLDEHEGAGLPLLCLGVWRTQRYRWRNAVDSN